SRGELHPAHRRARAGLRPRAVEASGEGSVTELDLADGTRRWHRALSLPRDPVLEIDGDVLYVATSGQFLEALGRADGRSAWRWSVGRSFDAMALPDGRLLVADSGGQLWAFARGGGPGPRPSPVAVQGRIRLPGEMERRPIQLQIGDQRVATDLEG